MITLPAASTIEIAKPGRVGGPGADHRGAGDQVGQRGLGPQAAARQHDHVVDCLRHLAEQVAGDEHGPALRRQFAEQAAEPADAIRVEPVERLVEDQHARVTEQRPGQAEPLAHAEREPADAAARDVGQPDQAEHLVDPAAGQAGRGGDDPQVLGGAAARVEGVAVQRGADLAHRVGQLMVGLAADGGGAGRGRREAEQDAQRGGLRELWTMTYLSGKIET
jgi:hypothetical protein